MSENFIEHFSAPIHASEFTTERDESLPDQSSHTMDTNKFDNINEESDTHADADSKHIPSEMTINQFMNFEGTMYAMETLEMLPEVPTEKKENVAFVVDNSRNVKLRETGRRAVFWDDCGICSRDKNNSAKHFYHFKDQSTYENVMMSKGKYCKNATEDKKRVRKPLDPQPSPSSIFILVGDVN